MRAPRRTPWIDSSTRRASIERATDQLVDEICEHHIALCSLVEATAGRARAPRSGTSATAAELTHRLTIPGRVAGRDCDRRARSGLPVTALAPHHGGGRRRWANSWHLAMGCSAHISGSDAVSPRGAVLCVRGRADTSRRVAAVPFWAGL